MIRKFTTVYPGHIDLPDRGQDATPANERRYLQRAPRQRVRQDPRRSPN